MVINIVLPNNILLFVQLYVQGGKANFELQPKLKKVRITLKFK